MSLPQPPRWAEAFFDFYCADRYREEIKGDLYELFDERCAQDSRRLARVRFVWEVLRFFRWRYLRKSGGSLTQQHIMVRNYLKISVRTLRKQRLHAAINIGGLALGLAACALILLYVRHERSYDSFHTSNLHTVYSMGYGGPNYQPNSSWWAEKPEDLRIGTILPLPLGEAIRDQVPGAHRVAPYSQFTGNFTAQNETHFVEFHFTNADFLRMFSFPVLSGSPNALANPNQLAITESTAQAWFGDRVAVGQPVEMGVYGSVVPMEVGAVVQDPPANSTLQFEVLVPYSHRPNYSRMMGQWGSWQTQFFVELDPTLPASVANPALDSMVWTHLPNYQTYFQELAGLDSTQQASFFRLLPLQDLHVNPLKPHWTSTHPRYLMLLSGLALVILLIASINYISLSLSRSAGRNMEVGIRKSLGASGRSIMSQFYVETALISTLALLVALGLCVAALPQFSKLANSQLPLRLLIHPGTLAIMGTLLLGTTLLAGSYPALYFARFRTASVLKGRSLYNVRSGFLRGLVWLQITLSTGLVVGALGIFQQMNFMLTKDLGYQAESVIRVTNYMGGNLTDSEARWQALRNRAATSTAIKAVSGIDNSFGQGWSNYGFRTGNEDETVPVFAFRMTPGFDQTLDIRLREGSNGDTLSSLSNKWIVNEAFVEKMGLEAPAIGTQMTWGNEPDEELYEIIGVVKNFHFQSLEHDVRPALIHFNADREGLYSVLVRAEPGKNSEALREVEQAWNELAPGLPFEYSFLQEDVQTQYEAYAQLKEILSYATGLALLIAILGLFGLSGIQALNRTKEIGVRKVLGARVWDVFLLLNRQTLLLSLVAMATAVPLAAWWLNDWLEIFAYRITLGWTFFVPMVVSLLAIVMLTVSYYTLRAANTNPSRALRDE